MLFKEPSEGRFYKHESPFTYFSSAELHLGEISLECSRPGASAVALWATQQLFPLQKGGEFAGDLDRCLTAARNFHKQLHASDRYLPLMQPELDIVVYAVAAGDARTSGERARSVFARAAGRDLHLAMIELPTALVQRYAPDLDGNTETMTCLRSVLMKPEHQEWLGTIMDVLEDSASDFSD